jgi:hypothetical protein
MYYVGDFATGVTVHGYWNSAGSTGASITRATNGTISVYKNGGTTQTTTGVTDTEDFDSLTGVHYIAIDTSSDGTFYATGNDFNVVLSAATIDGVTVNAVLFSFSLNNRAALRPTTAGRTLDVSSGGEAGVDWANVGSPTTSLNLSGTSVGTAAAVTAISAGGITSGSYALPTTAAYALGIIAAGTAQSATSSAIVLASATNFVSDSIPVGGTLIITGGTGVGESRTITAYTNSSDTATVSPAWTTTPDNTSTYVLFAGPPAVSTSLPDVNVASFTAGAFTSGAYASGAITSTAFATDALSAAAVSAAAATKVANSMLDQADGVETGVTVRQGWRLALSALVGKLSGAATTTVVIRNAVADSKNRITATVDSSGNRSAITTDLT